MLKVSKIVLFLALILTPTLCYGQGFRYDGVVQSRSGQPAAGATVAVCIEPATVSTTPCSTLTTLYTDSTLTVTCTGTLQPPPAAPGGANNTCSNPMVADGLGNYHFYVLPGQYAVQFYGSSLTTYSMRDQVFACNPTNCTGGAFKTVSVDGSRFPTLASALAYCNTNLGNNCRIDDSTPETFASNPFAGFNGLAKITFGPGTWTLNAQVTVPSGVSLFQGSGRVGTGNTLFKAGGSMPTSTPLIKALGTQGQVFGNFIIDCNSVSGATGLFATDWNENSGIEKIAVINCGNFSVNVDGSLFTSIPAQNYFIRDVESFSGLAGTGSTIGVHLKGNGGGGPGDVRNITASGQGGHIIQASLQVENFQQATFQDIHGEFATNVFQSTANSISNFTADTITGTATDVTVVRLDGATSTGFMIRNIVATGATNTLIDAARSFTITPATDPQLSFYWIGPGAVGQEDINSSSNQIPKFFNSRVQYLNTTFAALGTPPNGTFTYCSDCTIANPCAGAGNGAFAKRLNGVWVCN